jgi:hypothetical protein
MAERPSLFEAHLVTAATEHRAGTYIYNDRSMVRMGHCSEDECAMHVLATVVSRPTADRAVIDAGSKALTSDLQGFSDYGTVVGYPEARYHQPLGRTRRDRSVEVHRPAGRRSARSSFIIPNHTCVVSNLFDTMVFHRERRRHARRRGRGPRPRLVGRSLDGCIHRPIRLTAAISRYPLRANHLDDQRQDCISLMRRINESLCGIGNCGKPGMHIGGRGAVSVADLFRRPGRFRSDAADAVRSHLSAIASRKRSAGAHPTPAACGMSRRFATACIVTASSTGVPTPTRPTPCSIISSRADRVTW